MLARACARGNERAWEHFIAVYRQPLTRAAIAITGSETLGRDLADQLYAELYGLNVRDGERRCPLLSYRGRGSLMGWLRTTLAQRHVDHYRRTRREEPIEEFDAPAPEPPPQTPARELSLLEQAIEQAVSGREAEERYLLAAYYLDGQTLLEIARVLGVHEATVSRKLHRAAERNSQADFEELAARRHEPARGGRGDGRRSARLGGEPEKTAAKFAIGSVPRTGGAMTATSQHGFHPDAESLSAFAEQALGERERAEVLAHLAVCGRCRQVVALAREAADAGD